MRCSGCCKQTIDAGWKPDEIPYNPILHGCSHSLQVHLNLLLSGDITNQSICNPLILLHHPCRNFNLSNYQLCQDVTQLTLEIWLNDGWVLGEALLLDDDVMMLGITLSASYSKQINPLTRTLIHKISAIIGCILDSCLSANTAKSAGLSRKRHTALHSMSLLSPVFGSAASCL